MTRTEQLIIDALPTEPAGMTLADLTLRIGCSLQWVERCITILKKNGHAIQSERISEWHKRNGRKMFTETNRKHYWLKTKPAATGRKAWARRATIPNASGFGFRRIA